MTNDLRHYGLVISHSAERHGLGISHSAGGTFCVLRGFVQLAGLGLAGVLVPASFCSSAANLASTDGLPG